MLTPDFAAYAVGIEVRLSRPITPAEIRSRVESLLTLIAQECDRAGATLIGHIKCVVETDGKGFMAVSVLDPTGKPTTRGELQEGITDIDIILNVLLYGLTRSRVQELVDPLALRYLAFPEAEIELEDLEKGHHEHTHDGHEDHDHNHC